jgi:NAD(P)-dependent dehydrogenase (short-subunit alcohol dehydrogenase family)
MTINQTGTSVLITGGNRGLGYETARRLGERGWQIFLGSRDEDRGRQAAEKLAAGGADVITVPLDVTSDDSVSTAIGALEQYTDHLDVLINNAGIVGDRVKPIDTTAQDLLITYDVNVFGPVRVTKACLPLLRNAAKPRVVMVSSGMGSVTITSDPARIESTIVGLAYTSSKTALNMITTQYAKALPEIKFNIADPGYTATDLNHHTGMQTVTEGTDAIVRLAVIGADGPTGIFIDRHGSVPW